jgi:hypothetical protein
MRNRMKYGMAIAAIAAGLVTQSAKAVITNGGFENGNQANAVPIGYTGIGDVTSFPGFNPVEGTSVAILSNIVQPPGKAFSPNSATTNIGSLESAAGLPAGTLTALNVKSGSTLSQTFFATANDNVTFSYNFITDEALVGGNPDFGFYTLKGPTGVPTLVTLGTPTTATNTTGNPPPANQKDIFDFMVNGSGRETNNTASPSNFITTTGLYTITFGVANVNDTNVLSGLVIDNLAGATGNATGVPLPAAVLLAPLGMAVAARCSRKFRRQQA